MVPLFSGLNTNHCWKIHFVWRKVKHCVTTMTDERFGVWVRRRFIFIQTKIGMRTDSKFITKNMVSWLDVNQSIIKIKYLTNYVWHIEPQRQCHVRCLVSSCWRLFLNGSGLDHNRFAWTTRNFCLAVTVALVKTKIFWNTFIKYTVDRKESFPTKTQTLRYMFSLPRPQQLLFKYSNRIILKVRRVQPITYHHLIFILAYPLWGQQP